MDPLTLVVIVAVCGGAWFWLARGGRSQSAERELRRICLGNEEQAERLIEFELTRAPGLSRSEAAHRAVDRYRRDNR